MLNFWVLRLGQKLVQVWIYSAKLKAGADLINFKSDAVDARAGFNVDTCWKHGEEGVEAKLGGFGLSVGKKTGISLPVGEVKVDFDECVIQ